MHALRAIVLSAAVLTATLGGGVAAAHAQAPAEESPFSRCVENFAAQGIPAPTAEHACHVLRQH